jgi:hypothetical protein
MGRRWRERVISPKTQTETPTREQTAAMELA